MPGNRGNVLALWADLRTGHVGLAASLGGSACMRYVTYLIYIILWEGLIFGGAGYAVFFLDRSGWWILAACIVGGLAYSPAKWIHGKTE